MKSLEVNEEKSMAKQDEYENTIRDLTSRLSQAESRAEVKILCFIAYFIIHFAF